MVGRPYGTGPYGIGPYSAAVGVDYFAVRSVVSFTMAAGTQAVVALGGASRVSLSLAATIERVDDIGATAGLNFTLRAAAEQVISGAVFARIQFGMGGALRLTFDPATLPGCGGSNWIGQDCNPGTWTVIEPCSPGTWQKAA